MAPTKKREGNSISEAMSQIEGTFQGVCDTTKEGFEKAYSDIDEIANRSNADSQVIGQLQQEFNEYRTESNQRLDEILEKISNPQNPQNFDDEFLKWLGDNIIEKDGRIGRLDGRVNEIVDTVRELYKNYENEQQNDSQRGRDGRGNDEQGNQRDNQRRDEEQPSIERDDQGDYQRGRDRRGNRQQRDNEENDQPPREEDNQEGDGPDGYDRQNDEEEGQSNRDEQREEQPQQENTNNNQQNQEEQSQQQEQLNQEEQEEAIVEEPAPERTGVIKSYYALQKQIRNEINGTELDIMQCYVLAAREALKVEGDIRQIDKSKLEESVGRSKYLLSLYKNLSERAKKTMFVSGFKDESHEYDVVYGRYGFDLPSLEGTVKNKKSQIKYEDIMQLCGNKINAKLELPATKIEEEDTGKVLSYVGLKSGRKNLERKTLKTLLDVYEANGKIVPQHIQALNERDSASLSYK